MEILPNNIKFNNIVNNFKNTLSGEAKTYIDDKTGRTILKLTSVDNTTTKINNMINVSEGNCIQVNLLAKVNNIEDDAGSVKVRYYKDSIQLYNGHHYEITSTDRFKDHKFRFPVPEGVNKADVILYVKSNNEMYVKNYEILNVASPEPPQQGVRFIAHLGMTAYAPRNTYQAFELAKRAGFWGCIINTGMTSDGYIVCLHNQTIDATSNGTGDISTMTLEQARSYDYGSYFNSIYAGAQLPLLDDVLKFCAISGLHPVVRISHKFLDDSDGVFTKIYDMVIKYGLLNKISFKGCYPEGLKALYAIAGNTVRYGLYVEKITESDINFIKTLGDNPFIDIEINGFNEKDIQTVKAAGLTVSAWVVNNFMLTKKLIDLGFTEFTTDNMCLDGCMF